MDPNAKQCSVYFKVTLVATLAISFNACQTEKSRNPLSPNIAGPMDGVNITAPPLLEPTDGELMEAGQRVTLKFSSVSSNSERPFWYEVQVARDLQFQQLIHEADLIGWNEAEGTSQNLSADGNHYYELPISLESEQLYWWRARAADGANIGPYSESANFEIYTAVSLGVPQPQSPIEGITLSGLQPTFVVSTPEVEGPATDVIINVQLASSHSFASPLASFETIIGSDNTTKLTTSHTLSSSTRYYWRARTTAEGRRGQILGSWSQTSIFLTPTDLGPTPSEPDQSPPPSGGEDYTQGGSPNAPFTTDGNNPPNMLHIVQQIAQEYPQALENSCQAEGGSWEFMDRVVERLRSIDGRYAYNCKRGNCADLSQDVINYYRGSADPNGSTEVEIVDMIVGHCTSNPQPGWNSVTEQTYLAGTVGRWKYPR